MCPLYTLKLHDRIPVLLYHLREMTKRILKQISHSLMQYINYRKNWRRGWYVNYMYYLLNFYVHLNYYGYGKLKQKHGTMREGSHVLFCWHTQQTCVQRLSPRTKGSHRGHRGKKKV
jgi:hypothetical protein